MGSRTITASFSQNRYSEEVFKISQHLKKRSEGLSHAQEDSEVQEPPGFERIIDNHDKALAEDLSNNQGQERGLNGVAKHQARQSQDTDLSSKKYLQNPGKLLQQGLQQTKTSRSNKTAKNAHQYPEDTEDTTDSMIQIAEESLQVGELLGVRVVGNKKAAVARITAHLKTRKAQEKTTQDHSKQQKL